MQLILAHLLNELSLTSAPLTRHKYLLIFSLCYLIYPDFVIPPIIHYMIRISFNRKWAYIAAHMPGRSDVSIKNRYHSTMRSISNRYKQQRGGSTSLNGQVRQRVLLTFCCNSWSNLCCNSWSNLSQEVTNGRLKNWRMGDWDGVCCEGDINNKGMSEKIVSILQLHNTIY